MYETIISVCIKLVVWWYERNTENSEELAAAIEFLKAVEAKESTSLRMKKSVENQRKRLEAL